MENTVAPPPLPSTQGPKSQPVQAGGTRGLKVSLAALLLTFVIPLGVLQIGRIETEFGAGSLLAWVLVAWSSLRIAVLADRVTRPRYLALAFWIFVYVFFGLAWLVQFELGTFPLPNARYTNEVITAPLLVMVGCVAFDLGARRAARAREQVTPSSSPSASRRRLALFLMASCLVTGFGILSVGIDAFLASRDVLSEAFLGPASSGQRYFEGAANQTRGELLLKVTRIPIFVGLLTALISGAWRWGLSFRILIVIAVVLNLIVSNPRATPRFWFGTVVIAFLVSARYWRRWNKLARPKVIAATLIVVLVGIFSLLDAFRRSPDGDFHTEGPRLEMATNGDFSQSQQVMNGLTFTERVGHAGGRQLATSLFIWVPRAIWESKGIDTGQIVQPPGVDRNPSASLWIEGYVDFGIAGTMMYLFAFGYAAGKIDRNSVVAVRGEYHAVLLALLTGYQFLVLRGSLQTAVAHGLVIAISMVGIFYNPSTLRRTRWSRYFEGPG